MSKQVNSDEMDRLVSEAERCEYVAIIQVLLAVLPDSLHQDAPTRCWDWAWDELDDEAQEQVKAARRTAELFIKRKTESHVTDDMRYAVGLSITKIHDHGITKAESERGGQWKLNSGGKKNGFWKNMRNCAGGMDFIYGHVGVVNPRACIAYQKRKIK